MKIKFFRFLFDTIVILNLQLGHSQRSTSGILSSSLSSFDGRYTGISTLRPDRFSADGDAEPDNFHHNTGRHGTTREPPGLGSFDLQPEWTTRRSVNPSGSYGDRERTSTSPPLSFRIVHTMPPHHVNPEGDQPDRKYHGGAPSINVTVDEFQSPILWDSANEASLSIRNLRLLKLTFTCNATYPIEWISQTSFGTDRWEINEFRNFIRIKDHYEGTRLISQYTVALYLTYEKQEHVPKHQEFSCASIIFRNDFQDKKQSVMEITKLKNSTLTFKIITNIHQWPKVMTGSASRPQYSRPLGTNLDCLVNLKFGEDSESNQIFQCYSETADNLTIDYRADHCEDYASCQRRFNHYPVKCPGPDYWRNPHIETKSPFDMWLENDPPPAGAVYCARQNDTMSQNEDDFANKTATIPFFHSLPRLCPQDEPKGRHQLYIGNGIQDNYLLEESFMSFCTCNDAFREGTIPPSLPTYVERYTFYAGERITVSCFASLYHFAFGTRILLMNSQLAENIAVATDFKTTVDHNRGFFNYTTKVLIKDTDVTEIICENYIKQSTSSIRKRMWIFVKRPRNITFINQTPLAYWNYSGQSNFSLKCEADGEPQPTISWTKEGRPISSLINEIRLANGSISILQFPSLKDKYFLLSELYGTYTCEAKNRVDKTEKVFPVEAVLNAGHAGSIASASIPVINPSGEPDASHKDEHKNDSIWHYVWTVVIPISVFIVVAIIGFLVWKIKNQSRELQLLSKAEVDEFKFGKPEILQKHTSTEEVNNYAPYLPYNKKYEIDRKQLEFDSNSVLGSGAYAVVLKGVLNKRDGYSIKVAIKTAKPMDDVSFFKALLSELKIMGFIGSHPNIVNLIGACTKNIQNREIYIAIEYCEKGNLLTYLRENRRRFTSQLNESSEIPKDIVLSRDSFVFPDKDGLSTITLLKWTLEVATGMEFLGKKKVIHGDLAARNILLTKHLGAKISDFGLSRQLFEYANYIKKHQSPLPWKWLAIECLQDMRFSEKSDVWAFSILLYEIFSLGQVPYPGHSYNDEFLEALVGGKRPSKPAHVTKDVYDLMTNCWNEDPEDRPTFTNIKELVGNILADLVPKEYLELHEKVAYTIPTLPSNAVGESTILQDSNV